MNAEQLINAGRQVEQSRLPIWTGIKDALTAEQWLERVRRAKHNRAGNWTDEATMSYIYNALRGPAMGWFTAQKSIGYNTDVFEEFAEAFLETYGTTTTVRTAALNLAEIKQGATELASVYMARVVQIFDDLREMAPADLPEPDEPFPDPIRNANGFAAVADAVKDAHVQNLLHLGARDAYNRVAMHIGIAGLKPHIRVKLMEANPTTLKAAITAAVKAERIASEPKKSGGFFTAVSAVAGGDDDTAATEGAEEDGDEEAEDAELAAIQHRAKMLKKKKAARNKKSHGNSKQPKQPAGSNSNPNTNGKCRYCLAPGHFQAGCPKRRAAGAPMVDQQGKPYQPRAVNGVAIEQQQQQQQGTGQMGGQNSQPVAGCYNPYAHYTQPEQGSGGVGAIWNPHQQNLNY